jgi:uncharacterized protein YkwD
MELAMDILNTLFLQLSHLFPGFNLLDLIIIAVIAFYAYEGYTLGFVLAILDLSSFILAFTAALKAYGVVASLIIFFFSMPLGFANAVGFFLTAFVCEALLTLLFRKIIRYAPSLPPANMVSKLFKKADHFLGLIPGALSAFIILSFLLTVIISLPSSPLIKNLVTGSKIGSNLIANTSLFEKKLNDIFGGALNETINFLTVEPKSNEVVDLHFKVTTGEVDVKAEQEMFKMVNTERIKNGVPAVFFDNKLRDVARAHSRDMFARGYFSHYTPEGLSPFDRMNKGDIKYLSAGENLALAPSTDLAMQGLMNSPGHRANILNPSFRTIGIGVIDGGIYGKMYSQEFTD